MPTSNRYIFRTVHTKNASGCLDSRSVSGRQTSISVTGRGLAGGRVPRQPHYPIQETTFPLSNVFTIIPLHLEYMGGSYETACLASQNLVKIRIMGTHHRLVLELGSGSACRLPRTLGSGEVLMQISLRTKPNNNPIINKMVPPISYSNTDKTFISLT